MVGMLLSCLHMTTGQSGFLNGWLDRAEPAFCSNSYFLFIEQLCDNGHSEICPVNLYNYGDFMWLSSCRLAIIYKGVIKINESTFSGCF